MFSSIQQARNLVFAFSTSFLQAIVSYIISFTPTDTMQVHITNNIKVMSIRDQPKHIISFLLFNFQKIILPSIIQPNTTFIFKVQDLLAEITIQTKTFAKPDSVISLSTHKFYWTCSFISLTSSIFSICTPSLSYFIYSLSSLLGISVN